MCLRHNRRVATVTARWMMLHREDSAGAAGRGEELSKVKLTQSTPLIALSIRGDDLLLLLKGREKLSYLRKVGKLWGEEPNPVAEL